MPIFDTSATKEAGLMTFTFQTLPDGTMRGTIQCDMVDPTTGAVVDRKTSDISRLPPAMRTRFQTDFNAVRNTVNSEPK
jgi:hypothetical protein